MIVPANQTHYLFFRHGTAGLTRASFTIYVYKNGVRTRDVAVEVVENPANYYIASFTNDGEHDATWTLSLFHGTSHYFDTWRVEKPIIEQNVKQMRSRSI